MKLITLSPTFCKASETKFKIEEICKTNIIIDPITGLICYPSFSYAVERSLSKDEQFSGVLAIGDVDDLKGYVTSEATSDNDSFGHLAGNECMAALGSCLSVWQERYLDEYSQLQCGTFGGDEVIIYAEYYPDTPLSFEIHLKELRNSIFETCPRPCSFVWINFDSSDVASLPSGRKFRSLAAQVDKSLFQLKSSRPSMEKENLGKMLNIIVQPDKLDLL